MARPRATAFCFSVNSWSLWASFPRACLSSRGGGGVDGVGGQCPVGQHGHDVVANLGEAAVHVVAMDGLLLLCSQLPIAQAADQRSAAGKDAEARRTEIGVSSIFSGLNELLLLRKSGPELTRWRDKTPRPP